jgi:hypothetical protein
MSFEHTREHPQWNPNRPRSIIHSLDEIPSFADECAEVAFWDAHEMSDELMDSLPPLPDKDLARLERIRMKRQQERARRATG